MSALIENIVNDYSEYGYGEKIDESTLKSHTDDTTVVLEAVYEEDNVVGITIYSNDLEVDTINYNDEHFGSRLSTLLAEELNV